LLDSYASAEAADLLEHFGITSQSVSDIESARFWLSISSGTRPCNMVSRGIANRRDSVWTGVALFISWKLWGPTGSALEGL